MQQKINITTDEKEHRTDKQRFCKKAGFSGNLSILPRSNFGVGGKSCSPQSLTAYSLNRCKKFTK